MTDHSQFGEATALASVFEKLGIQRGTFVDVGSWDGKHLSNVYDLFRKGWAGVFIEGDPEKFKELEANIMGQAICVNRMVGLDGDEALEAILHAAWPHKSDPCDYDLLCIDIDGVDYWVWESVKFFKPKVVVVEFNPTIPNHHEYVPPRDPAVHHGCALSSLLDLGRAKGYKCFGTSSTNALFMRADLFDGLGWHENGIDALHPDKTGLSNVIQFYDGTLQVVGVNRRLWDTRPEVFTVVTMPAPEAP